MPTVAVAVFKERVENLKYPRAALVKFPRGATVGRPRDAAQQRRVILDTLELLRTARTPAAFVELEHKWAA